MSWVPTNDFEEEVVALQPDHDFIYGTLSGEDATAFYPRPKSHIDYFKSQKERQKSLNTKTQNHKLDVIAKVQRIAGTKPLGEQPTLDDWNDDNKNLERETIAMMRHFGYGPYIDHPLDEKCTIATLPVKDEMCVMYNGRKKMPIFFDEQFFKLKPRVSTSDNESGSDQNSTQQSTTTNSDDSSLNNEFKLDHGYCNSTKEENEKTHDLSDILTSNDESDNSRYVTANNYDLYDMYETERDQMYKSAQSSIANSGRNGSSNRIRDKNCNLCWRSADVKKCQHKSDKSTEFYSAKELYEKKRKGQPKNKNKNKI